MTPRPGLALGDRYTLVRQIATGGLGDVWEATEHPLVRRVSVTILKDEYHADPAVLARFRGAARCAAQLEHRSIATVLDVGESNDMAFLVTERAQGRPLSHLVEEQPGMPMVTTLSIVCQAAEGLQAAHDAGVIHGDVTPDNLLVRDDGVVKVAHVGIARALGSAPSAAYVAPEQARGGRVSDASDVYSLGAIAYALLAGHPPPVRDAPLGIAADEVPVPPLPDRVPPHVASIVEASLASDPSLRPASASDVARVLRREMATMGASVPWSAVVFGADEARTVAQSMPTTERDGRATTPHFRVVGALAALIVVGAIVWATASSRSVDTVQSEAPVPPVLSVATSAGSAQLDPRPPDNASGPTQLVIGGPDATRPTSITPAAAPSSAVAAPGAAVPATVSPTTVSSRTASPTPVSPTPVPAATAPGTTVPSTPTVSPTTVPSTTVPRTAAPTTAPPTTVPPTTVPPTTVPPTTAPPTTAPPTTAPPLTLPPLTLPPLTLPPLTVPLAGGPLTEDEAIGFVVDYYTGVAAGDYRTTWASLSDEFRDARDLTYSRYVSFWRETTLDLGDMRVVPGPDLDERTVVFDARYTTGSRVVTETDEVTLRRTADGSLVITAQRVV